MVRNAGGTENRAPEEGAACVGRSFRAPVPRNHALTQRSQLGSDNEAVTHGLRLH